jgi:HK97 gp10 family phage protein
MTDIAVEIKGLQELQRKAEQVVKDLGGAPLLNAMRDSVLMIERDAKILAPVDTGRLRASITPAVRSAVGGIQGVVGSNVTYAPYQEFGTKPHWPPVSALETWARRHHTSAFLVARSIAMKGTKARKYLQGAIEKNKAAIQRKFEGTIQVIVNK